jgi:hypothetical protein
MKPRPSSNTDLQGDLFKVELAAIINLEYPLAKLADQIDWNFFECALGEHFCEDNGAPAKPVRLMVGLHYLKHTYNLSDEQTVLRWVENPYWQHFCGEVCYEAAPDRRLTGAGTVKEMRAGPSVPVCRSRRQTTLSCVG